MKRKRNILFDNGVPRPLRKRLQPHRIVTTQELGWEQLKNGELLRTAETDFDVLITTDSNIKFQQSLPTRDIALIVLRAFRISMKYYEPLLPQILETLETIEPGQAVYIYADPRLAQKDQRKGRR